jgi:hypothetical protein
MKMFLAENRPVIDGFWDSFPSATKGIPRSRITGAWSESEMKPLRGEA